MARRRRRPPRLPLIGVALAVTGAAVAALLLVTQPRSDGSPAQGVGLAGAPTSSAQSSPDAVAAASGTASAAASTSPDATPSAPHGVTASPSAVPAKVVA